VLASEIKRRSFPVRLDELSNTLCLRREQRRTTQLSGEETCVDQGSARVILYCQACVKKTTFSKFLSEIRSGRLILISCDRSDALGDGLSICAFKGELADRGL
jgi:hypothetical protein